jgi:hypothetical protein
MTDLTDGPTLKDDLALNLSYAQGAVSDLDMRSQLAGFLKLTSRASRRKPIDQLLNSYGFTARR